MEITLCEIKAWAKWFSRNIKKTPDDREFSRVMKILIENDVFVVPIDRGNGFCVMRRQIYYRKLNKFLDCQNFIEIESRANSFTLKVEKDIKNTLEMKKTRTH